MGNKLRNTVLCLGLVATAAYVYLNRSKPREPPKAPVIAETIQKVAEPKDGGSDAETKQAAPICPPEKAHKMPKRLATAKDIIRTFTRYKGLEPELQGEGTEQRRVYSMRELPTPASEGICVGDTNVKVDMTVYEDAGRTGFSAGDSVSMMVRLTGETAVARVGWTLGDAASNSAIGLRNMGQTNERFRMMKVDVGEGERNEITRWMNVYLPDYQFGQGIFRVPGPGGDIETFDTLLTAANEVLKTGVGNRAGF